MIIGRDDSTNMAKFKCFRVGTVGAIAPILVLGSLYLYAMLPNVEWIHYYNKAEARTSS
jgi:hypothetical protein